MSINSFIPDIQPSAEIRKDYAGFSKRCHESNRPVIVTKNGEADLVVMSTEAYNQLLASVELAAKLIPVDIEITKGVESMKDAESVLLSMRELIKNA